MSENIKAVEVEELSLEGFGFKPEKLGNKDILAVAKLIGKHGKSLLPLVKQMTQEKGEEDAEKAGFNIMIELLEVGGEDVYSFIASKSGVSKEEFDKADPTSMILLIEWIAKNNDLQGFFKAAQKLGGVFSRG